MGEHSSAPVDVELTLRPGRGKSASLNGASLRAAEQLRARLTALVFTPDRLAVVKAGPAVRRAYFDRVLGRLFRARAGLPAEYGAAVAQRNAALRRIASGLSPRDTLDPWTKRVAALGESLVDSRAETVSLLQPAFAERAGELGLADAALGYDGEPPTVVALEDRVPRDLERGLTSIGPHLDDVALVAGRRDLRTYGSQGEQRLSVLALLLAESELLVSRGEAPPLLLLDDVLSELDERRQRILADRLRGPGQAFLTATTPVALPGGPDLLIEVGGGTAARAAA